MQYADPRRRDTGAQVGQTCSKQFGRLQRHNLNCHHNQNHVALSETAALHSEILNRLGPSPLAENQLIRDLKSAAAIVTPALIDLELEGKVTRQSGGLIALSVQ